MNILLILPNVNAIYAEGNVALLVTGLSLLFLYGQRFSCFLTFHQVGRKQA